MRIKFLLKVPQLLLIRGTFIVVYNYIMFKSIANHLNY